MIKLGLTASGGLGFKALQHCFNKDEVVFVLTDSGSSQIIQFCEENNIPFFKGNPRNVKAISWVSQFKIDVLASINYLFLLPEEIIECPDILAYNIHGSLLPKYRGRTPHVWAIINGEKFTGITAHVLVKECDAGNILLQKKIAISDNDTGADILVKFNGEYIYLIEDLHNKISNKEIIGEAQDHTKATYFGKRTPDDGMINWSWSKERIRNWVRAQANPYPGAFSYLNGVKVTIDRVEFNDFGFDYLIPNGTVLSVEDELIVKTPNGALSLTDIRNMDEVNVSEGDCFEINQIM